MTTRTIKDIQSVDILNPLNKGNFAISVDKVGDMCIKDNKIPVLHGFFSKNRPNMFLV
jgi:hypothetical protein